MQFEWERIYWDEKKSSFSIRINGAVRKRIDEKYILQEGMRVKEIHLKHTIK